MLNQPINLLTKQTQAWDLLETGLVDDVGYGGGAGGGKTDLGVKLATFIADQFPGSVGAIGRNALVDLKKTVLVSLFEFFGMQGVREKLDYRYDEKHSSINFSNTSIIYLLELKNRPRDPLYQNLGSLQLSWAWIEESNEVPFRAVDILSTRVGRANYKPEWEENLKKFFGVHDERLGKIILKPFILQTFNPGKGHVYRNYWKPFKKGTMKENRQFVRALPIDNPFLSSAYLNKLQNSDKPTRERLLLGNFDYDDDPQKIYIYDKITDLFTNKHVKEGEKYMVIDPAGKGKDKTVISIWNGWRGYKWYEEKKTDQSILVPKIRELQEKESVPNSNTICDYDGLGVGIVDNLKCKAFQGGTSPIATEEEEEQEIKPNYKNLRSQCSFYTADKVNKNEVYIENVTDEQKEYITEELDVIKEINDGRDQKKQIIPKGSNKEEPGIETIRSLLGRSPDYADTIMMRAWFELGAESPLFFSIV